MTTPTSTTLPGNPPAPGSAVPDLAAVRLARIHDYQREGLAKGDALEANLAAISGDLMLMAFRLNQGIELATGATAIPVERMGKLLGAIDMSLKVARQIDRFAQLDHRLTLARQAAVSSQTAPATEVGRSEESVV